MQWDSLGSTLCARRWLPSKAIQVLLSCKICVLCWLIRALLANESLLWIPCELTQRSSQLHSNNSHAVETPESPGSHCYFYWGSLLAGEAQPTAPALLSCTLCPPGPCRERARGRAGHAVSPAGCTQLPATQGAPCAASFSSWSPLVSGVVGAPRVGLYFGSITDVSS